MRLSRIIAVTSCIIVFLPALTQETLTKEKSIQRTIYYELDLIPTGKVNKGDSVFQVVLTIDPQEIAKFRLITIESSKRNHEVNIVNYLSSTDNNYMSDDNKILLDMSEWSSLEEACVIGTKTDGSKVVLRPAPDPDAVVHDVKTLWTQTRDIAINTNDEVPDEEKGDKTEESNSKTEL